MQPTAIIAIWNIRELFKIVAAANPEGYIQCKNISDDLINAESAVQRALIEMTAVGLRDLLTFAEPVQQCDGRIGEIIERQQERRSKMAAARKKREQPT